MPIEQAIFEVLEANAKAKEITPTRRLVERMQDGEETIADLLLKRGQAAQATMCDCASGSVFRSMGKQCAAKNGALRCLFDCLGYR